MIAGRSLPEWQDFARRDDCLDRMVPSDLRELVGEVIDRGRDVEARGQAVVSLRFTMARARDRFRDYAKEHRAKAERLGREAGEFMGNTRDNLLAQMEQSNRKAEVNDAMAADLQAAILASREVVPSEKVKD